MILNFARHKIYNEQDKWSCNVTLREEDAQTVAKHNQLEKIEATNSFTNVSKKFPGKKSICYNKNNLQYNQIPLASSPCSVHNFVERGEKSILLI